MKIVLSIPNFITHVAKTNNKTAENKYIKVNNQLIYNSNLNRFARNIVVRNLHEYLIPYIKKAIPKQLSDPPYQVALDIHVPINYGDVSRRKKQGVPTIIWKEPEKDYIPTWDIGNLGELWLKTFEDALQKAGAIKNDHIGFITRHGPISFYPVKDLNDRRLDFIIKKID